jgi:hypothetical protein
MVENPIQDEPKTSRWRPVLWALAFVSVLAWQALRTLGLFGASLSADALLDERPVLSGFHPQHQYLGQLGAVSFAEHGQICVYDPAFQAGYPKTPIFNNSRLAELFMLAGGGGFQPHAYKIGLASVCLLVPVFLMLAGLSAGIGPAASLLASLAGAFLWWGPHGRGALESGDLDLLLAALALLTHMGLLLRFHHSPGFFVWLGLVLTACLGWFLQPMLLPVALPLLLIYYLCVGIRHGSLTWHLALAAAETIALAVNLFWLLDWFAFWWVRSPLPLGEDMLRHRTFQTIWDAPLWGSALERGLAAALLLSAVAGCLILHFGERRPASRVLGLGGFGIVFLAVLGISWEPLGHLGTTGLLLPGLWFAALPAAYAWSWGICQIRNAGPVGYLMLAAMGLAAGGLAVTDPESATAVGQRFIATEPLTLGIGPERESIIEQLKAATTSEARILWEDRQRPRHASRWPALLPLWTDRAFIGGLDGEGIIEHSSIGLREGVLAGKPLASWTAEELDEYCTRYNVGWIASWTQTTTETLSQWAGAEKVTSLFDDGPGWLFAVKSCPRSFSLKGRAEMHQASSRHITLSNVEPDQGVVVLSLHYQTGMRATPSRVQVEREPCGKDPIGFVRLRVNGPVARMTLTWEGR